MGTYVEFVAKEGCADQINTLYAALCGNDKAWLVHSERVIEGNIAYIHSPSGEQQAHLRPYLKTSDDWDRLFPAWRRNTGQIKVSGVDDDDIERVERTRRDVQFLLDNRMLFEKIKNLDDARRLAFTDFAGDLIERNKTKQRVPEKRAGFADLPRARSRFYAHCVQHDRPDLWEAYLRFKDAPSEASWEQLRCKVVPWLKQSVGLWGAVERLATARDGHDYGLSGRFRDGVVPPLTLVRQALMPTKEEGNRS